MRKISARAALNVCCAARHAGLWILRDEAVSLVSGALTQHILSRRAKCNNLLLCRAPSTSSCVLAHGCPPLVGWIVCAGASGRRRILVVPDNIVFEILDDSVPVPRSRDEPAAHASTVSCRIGATVKCRATVLHWDRSHSYRWRNRIPDRNAIRCVRESLPRERPILVTAETL